MVDRYILATAILVWLFPPLVVTNGVKGALCGLSLSSSTHKHCVSFCIVTQTDPSFTFCLHTLKSMFHVYASNKWKTENVSFKKSFHRLSFSGFSPLLYYPFHCCGLKKKAFPNRNITQVSWNPTSSGNSSLTRDIISDVFPTLAVKFNTGKLVEYF